MNKTTDQLSKFFRIPSIIAIDNMPDVTLDNPCMLAGGGAKMTWNSFASSCLWRKSKNKTYNIICNNCKIGEAIERGEKVAPPDGIEIIEPDGWIEQEIKQPPKRWVPASKYNFHTMEIGEVYIDNIENAKRCRSAQRNISVRYGKEFVIEIIDNTIEITRVK